VLRPLELVDAEQVQLIFPQWEIVRYLDSRVPWPYPPGGAFTFYRDVALPAVERGDAWHWTLRLKSDLGTIIGSVALMRGEHENRGYWIAPPWQGQGLMSEACDAVTDYWFTVLKFPQMRVAKAVANTASRRISEKQGMRMVATGERDHVSGRQLAEVWEITAEEWKARQGTKD